MISDSKRFVFVHIPRTAGTSVETALAQYAREPIGFTANDCTVLDRKHSTALELRTHMGSEAWEASYRFSIVRNPWSRMYSDYHFFRRIGPRLEQGFSPLEVWLTRLALTHDFHRWLHIAAPRLDISQSSYLEDRQGALLVDFVARFETIEADFARICDAIGVSHTLPRVNGAGRGDYREAYTPAGIALVARYARRDIERFGYAFDPAVDHTERCA